MTSLFWFSAKSTAKLSFTNEGFDEETMEEVEISRGSKLSVENLLPMTTVPSHLCSKDCLDAKIHFDGFHQVNGELIARRRTSRPSIDSTPIEPKQFVDHF